MQAFMRQLRPALVALAVFTVITGLAYPMAVTGVAQLVWNDKADGSVIERDGVAVGSALIGQSFVAEQYFHPRPSAAGDGYDASASSGSNLGPTSPDLLAAIDERVAEYRRLNGLADTTAVPVDAVTASGSGLDPHISPLNARLQAARIAEVRGIGVDVVLEVIADATDGREFGFLGDPGVNVLEANLALDALAPMGS